MHLPVHSLPSLLVNVAKSSAQLSLENGAFVGVLRFVTRPRVRNPRACALRARSLDHDHSEQSQNKLLCADHAGAENEVVEPRLSARTASDGDDAVQVIKE